MTAAKQARSDVDTSTWLTCAEASDLLRCSEGTIRAAVRRDMLHPQRGKRVLNGGRGSGMTKEVDIYDPHELTLLSRRRKMSTAPNDQGELSARAFELFDRGKSLREVVIDLRETPARISELHDQWFDLGGSEMVIGSTAKAELERFLGAFDDVAGLVARVAQVIGRSVEIVLTEEAPDEAHDALAKMTDAQIEQRMEMLVELGRSSGDAIASKDNEG